MYGSEVYSMNSITNNPLNTIKTIFNTVFLISGIFALIWTINIIPHIMDNVKTEITEISHCSNYLENHDNDNIFRHHYREWFESNEITSCKEIQNTPWYPLVTKVANIYPSVIQIAKDYRYSEEYQAGIDRMYDR